MTHVLKASGATVDAIQALLCGADAHHWTPEAVAYIKRSIAWQMANSACYATLPPPLDPVTPDVQRPLVEQVHPIAMACALLRTTDDRRGESWANLYVYDADAWHRVGECTADLARPVAVSRPEGFNTPPPPDHGVTAAPAPTQEEPQAPRLPATDVTVETRGATGRPRASKFAAEISPEVPKARHPSWWEAFLEVYPLLLTHTAQDAVGTGAGVDRRCKAYQVALVILDRQLQGAPQDLTVAELRSWIGEITAALAACPAAPQLDAFQQYALSTTLVDK